MATVGCLRCGVWYDPGRPHLCGVLGDDTARALAERLDAFERRLQGLEGEARSRFNALERLVEGLEAALADDGSDFSEPSPETVSESKTPENAISENSEAAGLKPRFDRKGNHRRYMREWRARQTALRRQQQGVRP
jgi:hypothetical protein